MKNGFARPFMAALFAASLPLVAACSKIEEGGEAVAVSADEEPAVTETLAAALGDAGELSTLNEAIGTAELGTVFDGPGSYTLLAPTNEAFEGLGGQSEALMTEDQRPILIALLRNHILPGHLTPENIDQAIAAKGGPVTMTTLGGGNVTFSKDGERITVANDNGDTAIFDGNATPATNGAIIPIGSVLLPPKEATEA